MQYFIGWDVGAWKCTNADKKSCDALVIMDEAEIVGHHRNNVSESITHVMRVSPAVKAADLINAWFARCKTQREYLPQDHYFVAIDTPLGWPKGFTNLLKGSLPKDWAFRLDDEDNKNPLLYRKTERTLTSGFSVVTQSIGSQSTKGMTLLLALEATAQSWGVWQKDNVTLFETYPKACLLSKQFVKWMTQQPCDSDIRDYYQTRRSRKSRLKMTRLMPEYVPAWQRLS
jgi:hypothetical protein